MARRAKSSPGPIEPKSGSRDIPDEEPAAVIEPEDDELEAANGRGMNKSQAARGAVDAGYEKPAAAVEYIKEEFGIDLNPQHFSAIKSGYLKRQGETKPAKKAAAKPGRKPKDVSGVVEGYLAPPTKTKAPDEPDVLLALESIKELVGLFGAEKLKRMVDIIG